MVEVKSNYWKEIQDLPPEWQSLRHDQTETLVGAWQKQAISMQDSDAYKTFLIKLRRQWAIETGVLERLYSISDGATKTLIEQGLDAAFISSGDTDRSVSEVVAVIKDQYNAIEGLYQFISGNRPLGKSYLKELHAVLTANQSHYDAIDTLGQRVQRELPRGVWKSLKNNVEGPDDFIFEFCPPEHVESEMVRLLQMHTEHEKNGVPPEIEAAWLHHRFTLIHPFIDGNGRVARCLATLVLLKHKWFPLVVTRNERMDYINALRSADSGDLMPLIHLFCTLQTRSVRQAMSLSEETAGEATAMKSVLGAIKNKLTQQLQIVRTQKMEILKTGDALYEIVSQQLADNAVEINRSLGSLHVQAFADQANRRNPKDAPSVNFHRFQIVSCAQALGYYANQQVYQAWARLVISSTGQLSPLRTELLFAFHGIGGNSDGVLVCSAMAYTKQPTDEGKSEISEIRALIDEPFYFTYDQDPTKVAETFRKWANSAILKGLDYWRKGLGA